jgi:hypothetical protein
VDPPRLFEGLRAVAGPCFNAWYAEDGPQNCSFWDNKEFQVLSAQIDREVDAAKRLASVGRPKRSWKKTRRCCRSPGRRSTNVWYNYVKGHNPYEYFGIYDVVRQDTVWPDKLLLVAPTRKRGSRVSGRTPDPWIPAFAGMTNRRFI